MLNPQTRRARKVHLTGSSEDLIRRGAVLLEDALHTASLPESDGRLLVVKSLHVGMIRPDASSATLALAIERRLREVAAVHASDSTAHLREAVYFRDDAEPSILLALRLARHEPTSAWFWRLAVPAWKPEMSRDDALRTIFFTVTRTKAGLGAAIRLAGALEEQNALDPLLTAIHPQDGAGLLQAFGWSKSSKMIDKPIEISARWQPILTRWIPRWGQDDARALWLAGVALAADNPIRLLDGDLMSHAAQVVEGIANVGKRAHSRAPLQTTSDDVAGVRAGLRPALTENHMPEKMATQKIAPTDTANSDDVGAHGDRRKSLWDDAPMQNNASPAQPILDITDEQKSENHEKISPPVEMSTVGARRAVPLQTPDSEIVVEPDFAPAPWPDTPMKTQHGGLFFVIPVLARLGIAEFLTPELIEAMFPFRLLQYIGQHLGLPDDDPINAVMATDAAYNPQTHFVAPESWQSGIANPGEPILRRVGEKNTLYDSSGRLALARWEGEVPDGIEAWIGDSRTSPPNPLPEFREGEQYSQTLFSRLDFEPSALKTSHDLLCHAWMTAARRWLRRNAQLGLADLVLRPGRITATRTHIDIFFNLAQADICVRRVGLDIDPGWVSWLGRVVSFHYREEGQ